MNPCTDRRKVKIKRKIRKDNREEEEEQEEGGVCEKENYMKNPLTRPHSLQT